MGLSTSKTSDQLHKIILKKYSIQIQQQYFNGNIFSGLKPSQVNQQPSIQQICCQEHQSRFSYQKQHSKIECCIKFDTRKLVQQTSKYPYCTIGKLVCKSQRKQKLGTAFLVGPNIALTAAQNLFDIQNRQEYTDLQFYLALNHTKGYKCKAKKMYYPKQFKEAGNKNQQDYIKHFDYGIIQLNASPGEKYGYLGLDFRGNRISCEVIICGYPNNIFFKNQAVNVSGKMYKDNGKCITNQFDGERVQYSIPTSAGQNGGPILKKYGDHYVAVGINTNGDNLINEGVVLTSSKKMQINMWISKISAKLNLYCMELIPADILYLIQLKQIQHNQVIQVNLSLNAIANQGLKHFCSIKWLRLKTIFLRLNKIGDEGVKYLCEAQWQNVTQIYFDNNQVTDQGLQHLIIKKWQNLLEFSLTNNKISKQCQKIIQQKNIKNQLSKSIQFIL